jgi:nitroreductase
MFRKDLVPQGDIESLLAVAGMAPTATNMRSISWLVISGREQMVKIADLIVDYLETQDLSSYYKPLIKLYRNGNDVILRGASQLIISLRPNDWPWTEDGVIALTYLEIAAHSRGIGMCWAGFFTMAARNYKPLQDYLGIDGSYVCGAQMTGYPLLKTKKIPMRTPLDVKFR